jgi:hypothetical protein
MEPEFTAAVQANTSTTISFESAAVTTSLSCNTVSIRLFHGTDLNTALWIQENGLSFERMVEYCTGFGFGAGYFWTTTRMRIACQYSHGNPAVAMNGVLPAVVSFVLPMSVVRGLESGTPPLVEQWSVEDADYRFHPEAFATVNAAMTDRMVSLTAEVQIDD